VAIKRIEFAGGGTAGHLFPAIALAHEFKSRFPMCEIQFWGTKRGVEYRLRNQIGFRLRTIRIRGFKRQFSMSNLLIPFELITSFFVVLFHFLVHRPDLVVGTGGYVSGPVVFTASRLGIKSIVHEQNSYPGATTRFLSKWVKRVYLTYETSKKYFKAKNKLNVLGNPIRPFFEKIDQKKALEEFGLKSEKNTLFVFGGSQGGLGLNNLISKIAPKLLEQKKNQIIWATGPNHYEKIKNQMGNLERLYLSPFIEKIHLAYSVSDLVLCRSGATTIAELTYLGIPAILMPFPFSTAGHQEFNARELEKAGAAKCFLEKETTEDLLYDEINNLLNDKNQITGMKKNMQNLARPNAANDIVSDLCTNLLNCE